MIFAFTNSKGGVGKTTLAVHLAVWLTEHARRVAFVDADVQASSSAWMAEAAATTKVFRLPTPDDILEQVPSLRGQFDDVVIDGPAGLSEVSRAILFVADLTLLPCGPSVLDLRAAADAIRVVRQAQAIRHGPPRAVLVPNKLQARFRLSQELVQVAGSLGISSVGGLHLRQAYAEAAGQGKVVWQLGPAAAAAAHEIKTLFEEACHDEIRTPSLDERCAANQ
jgi:chromosome partitioning protein